MERLSDDVLGLVLERISDGGDRKSCSEVSRLWFEIEALTRTRVRVLDSAQIRHFLPRFRNLTSMEVNVAISDQALRFVSVCCPDLQTIHLELYDLESQNDFGDDGLIALAMGCSRLEKIFLLSRNISDLGIYALHKHAEGLTVLHLKSCCSITDSSLGVIGGMESISELYLDDLPLVTDHGLELLLIGPACRTLRVLMLYLGQQITNVGVLPLRRISCLEELYLPYCWEVTDLGGVAISSLSNLKKLDLRGLWDISDMTLCAVAKRCRSLVDINLKGCLGITGRGLILLASSLPLERIDMSVLAHYGKVSSYHVVQIAEKCCSLKHLIVDRELEEGLSPSQREKLDGVVHWY